MTVTAPLTTALFVTLPSVFTVKPASEPLLRICPPLELTVLTAEPAALMVVTPLFTTSPPSRFPSRFKVPLAVVTPVTLAY